jgi:hypothetical protein
MVMDNDKINKIAEHLEKIEIFEYIQLLSRPWKWMFYNFLAGISRGFGIAIGMTIVVAIAIFLLRKFINVPILGFYIAEIVKIVEQYLKPGVNIN